MSASDYYISKWATSTVTSWAGNLVFYLEGEEFDTSYEDVNTNLNLFLISNLLKLLTQ